ncbi:MAG TPA: metallophosphoesterase [Spirochaetota bacterium]|nr:metallophosphoesterase [Spirochaetota bacterium]HPQ53809.1 metallophosphoesterase [Spirochaetota bacterium]
MFRTDVFIVKLFKGCVPAKAFALTAIAAVLSCSSMPKGDPGTFRFIITGNTYAESPFKGRNMRVSPTIRAINRDNPVFVVHIGDMIFGGHDWMGIKRLDITRQFRDFHENITCLRPLLFTVKGEMDLLDGSDEFYRKYTQRTSRYSFNYGALHCIVLDSCNGDDPGINKEQLTWLKKDIRRYKQAPGILVFLHHPVFTNDSNADPDFTLKNPEELHAILKQYPVTAVFSGHGKTYSRTTRDSIQYITAGCNFASTGNGNRNTGAASYTYYIVDYARGAITVQPKSGH